jgi:hypothetical protein
LVKGEERGKYSWEDDEEEEEVVEEDRYSEDS